MRLIRWLRGSDPATEPSGIVADMPQAYADAEKASEHGQDRSREFVQISLALLVAAAVFGAIDKPWAGLGAALAFVGSLWLTKLSKGLLDAWYDGRAVAETIKSLTFKYAVGGDPFALTRPDAPDRYRAALTEFAQQMHRLGHDLDMADCANAVAALERWRADPWAERREAYRTQRIQDQLTYYSRRGNEHRGSARTYQVISVVLQAAGLIGAILKLFDVTHLDLLGLLAAAAASIAAWDAFGDYTKTARAYEFAVAELNAIDERLGSVDEAGWPVFVADAEQAMSREHTAWIARRRAQ